MHYIVSSDLSCLAEAFFFSPFVCHNHSVMSEWVSKHCGVCTLTAGELVPRQHRAEWHVKFWWVLDNTEGVWHICPTVPVRSKCRLRGWEKKKVDVDVMHVANLNHFVQFGLNILSDCLRSLFIFYSSNEITLEFTVNGSSCVVLDQHKVKPIWGWHLWGLSETHHVYA